MTEAETLTTVISAQALLVSLIALYAQFFRKRSRLIGVLVNWDVGERPSWFDYVIINAGDVQVLIREVVCEGTNMSAQTECKEVPSVVSPGEIKPIHVVSKGRDVDLVRVRFRTVSAKGVARTAVHEVAGAGRHWPAEGQFGNPFRIR